jgi:arylformamidase
MTAAQVVHRLTISNAKTEPGGPDSTCCAPGPYTPTMFRIHDVSMPIRDGGVVYPGNPPIRIELQQAISRGDGANVSSVSFGSHTGTHVDAPRHFLDGGVGVDAMALERLIGPALVIAFNPEVRSIGAAELGVHSLAGHQRILLKTRNSGLLHESEFDSSYTYLAPDGAEHLLAHGVDVVGIDYLSIEQFHSGHHRTHRALLERGVIIIEGLDLSAVPAGVYQLICLPLRLEGLDGAPARTLLIEDG